MHDRRVDLNLLQTFHAVHATGNVSRAAEQLGVSQPTVSHALARLRRTYRDPLFVRSQRGVRPTPKAERLARAVEQALATIDAAVRETEQYDPAHSDRSFRLHMSDIGETVFLPRLIRELARAAPGVRIETYQLNVEDILPALESGEIDLALGYIPVLAGVQRRVLLRERYVLVMRSDHPMAMRSPTRAALRELRYVLVRSHPVTGEVLDELGLRDRIQLTIPHFMVLPGILAETDLAVLMPMRLATVFNKARRAFAVWQPRIRLPAFDVSVHWARRFEDDPGARWLREKLIGLFGER